MDASEEETAEDLAVALVIANSPFGRHEVLHTASVVMDMFDRHLLAHPAVEHGDEELKQSAEAAFDALFEFYKLCGEKFLTP